MTFNLEQREHKEFQPTLHPASTNANILHNHGTFAKTKKINISETLLSKLQALLGLCQFFHKCSFPVPGLHPDPTCIPSDLFPSAPLVCYGFRGRPQR